VERQQVHIQNSAILLEWVEFVFREHRGEEEEGPKPTPGNQRALPRVADLSLKDRETSPRSGGLEK
jgi:hypothetical protein